MAEVVRYQPRLAVQRSTSWLLLVILDDNAAGSGVAVLVPWQRASRVVAFTARGRAGVLQEPMAAAPDYAAIAIDVEDVDDHPQPAFEVEAGADRRWLDEHQRDALGQRVRTLTELATK